MDTELIGFSDKPFDQISLRSWYEITNLRERVFVVEQNCPYLDADGKDLQAHHIMGRDQQGEIAAYARIVHPEDQKVSMDNFEFLSGQQKVNLISKLEQADSCLCMPAIGRVVLDPSLRGHEWGGALMQYTMECCLRIYGHNPVFISAQKPLHDFYGRHGFVQSGPGYLEDDIPHIPMVYL